MTTSNETNRPRVVVIGAGFAGLTFCQNFPRGKARITVVDRQNHHLFQPLLYQVATAGLAAPDIAQPIRGILTKVPDIEVRMAEVTGIDLAAKRVRLDRGELSYDFLVIAAGGVTSYFGHPEWAEFASGLKTLDEAVGIRREVLLAFERAEQENDAEARAALMTMVVVGGGPTGVEMAGALAELAKRVLRRDFDHIDPTRARVVLVEAGPRLLAAFDEGLSVSAKRQLERLGVEVRTGEAVKAIRKGEVDLPGETIRAATIVWGAGIGANPLTRGLGVELDKAGRIKVEPDLSLPGHPEVFAAGDLVHLKDAKGQAVPGVAPAAMQMGKYLARLIATGERKPFAYLDKGSLATIGRSAGVAQFRKLRFSGAPAWLAWLGVHLIFLIGFRNKISVLIQWVYSYFTYKRGARIITGQGRP